MVTCSPIGLGINHELFVSLSGRETVSNFRWNFAKPSISSSQPRPYSANGEVIVIRGENLGGVFSPAEVNISDIECLDAQWFPAYETDGRPYVACRTQRDVVGSKSVAMKVAMQYSAGVCTCVIILYYSNSNYNTFYHFVCVYCIICTCIILSYFFFFSYCVFYD